MLKRKLLSVFVLYAFLLPTLVFGQAAAPAPYQAPKEAIEKIKEEGSKNSQVMQTLSYLTDVIGGRLTNSPNMRRANAWTLDEMKKWGMQNAHLEAWGPFGRGWELKDFKAEVVQPQTIPVIAYPKAWSPSTKGAVTGEVVYFEAKSDADFAKYKGQLRNKIVLMSPLREVKAEDKAFMVRYTDAELMKMAEAPDPASVQRPQRADQPQITPQMLERLKTMMTGLKAMNFLLDEGAAVIVDSSFRGTGGTLFVSGATVAQPVPENPADLFSRRNTRISPQDKAAEGKMLPQMTMAIEDYNRLVRMIKFGVKPLMTVNIETKYYDDDLMGYNTIAEIPGTDPKLKDEIVMLGGHLDSWHSSTGATDNAAGSAVAMEAARIILAAGLKPRRTIRVALWSGEEQGLFGSRAYVKEHFGEFKGEGDSRELAKTPEYEKLSAYYNLDNGTGKIRGVYLQGNAAAAPIFKTWLMPFADMGAKTLTLANTGGTDHLSFDGIGLPGFQFIQDEIEYDTRTHHSNQDNFDRIQADDMKQASTIMAAFVYQTAMMDGKLPRKEVK